jgi:hypothetical protein
MGWAGYIVWKGKIKAQADITLARKSEVIS